MKTYTQKIEKPQLTISYDPYANNPRNDSNLSLLVLRGGYGDEYKVLKQSLEDTANIAKNAQEHLELMKTIVFEMYGKILFADFITKYEHSSVCIKRGLLKGFDCSMIGFVFVTETQIHDIGTPFDHIESVINDEIEIYNQWLNGEVYQYCLYDKQGNEIERCSGFYEIESIKNYLPNEWNEEVMENYLQV